jgi:hypothetical protein
MDYSEYSLYNSKRSGIADVRDNIILSALLAEVN